METNLVILEKKAIEFALKNDWTKALEYNTLILKKNPNDMSAQIRLGKAQIHNKDFQGAVKTFKKVLTKDPINQIALKNLQIAKEGKVLTTTIHPKKLIKEPGTTIEKVIFADKRVHLEIGQILEMNIKKSQIDILRDKTFVGTIDDNDIIKSLNQAKSQKINVEASVIKIKENKVTIYLNSDLPIFKADKQDIKPYLKKGTGEDEEDSENEFEYETESEE